MQIFHSPPPLLGISQNSFGRTICPTNLSRHGPAAKRRKKPSFDKPMCHRAPQKADKPSKRILASEHLYMIIHFATPSPPFS